MHATQLQWEKSNWMFAARNLAIAMVGVAGLTNPPKMNGCIYALASFWFLNVVTQLFDAIGYNWYSMGDITRVIQVPAFTHLVLAALNSMAFHQSWEGGYPTVPPKVTG